MILPIKGHWLDRAIQVYNFHSSQCKAESDWNLTRTAEALNRSIGSVSQDILLARWSVGNENKLRRFKSMRDALSFVKSKQREIRLREI